MPQLLQEPLEELVSGRSLCFSKMLVPLGKLSFYTQDPGTVRLPPSDGIESGRDIAGQGPSVL